jgi:5-methylcytosine-specific restriction protein A
MPDIKAATVSEILEQLKPSSKSKVMDLVRAAGVDVSVWAQSRSAAANPSYCYRWAFIEPGKLAVLNIWFDQMSAFGDEIRVKLRMRNLESAQGNVPRSARAKEYDRIVQTAYEQHLPVRVIVMGDRKDKDPMAHARFRTLDEERWAVKSYDSAGEFVLVRGFDPDRYVDQFCISAVGELFPARREVTGKVFDRCGLVRQHVLNIAQGRCQYCNQEGFKTEEGKIYLETHHVIPLCEGGPDVVTNVVALCPNHHREAHFGSERESLRGALTLVVLKHR